MRQFLKDVLKRVPGLPFLTEYISRRLQSIRLKGMEPGEVFRNIYGRNTWGDPSSVSGPGSNLTETRAIREELPRLLRELSVSSVLDIPCGDFFWMSQVDLGEVEYTGGDIVGEIIEKNKKYQGTNISFERIDLINDGLPKVDLVLVRDCLVHFSFEDALEALRNIYLSRSRFLLTTTFHGREANEDIATGQWRPLNLQQPPFSFPEPEILVSEQHPQVAWEDKALGLWVVEELGEVLGTSPSVASERSFFSGGSTSGPPGRSVEEPK